MISCTFFYFLCECCYLLLFATGCKSQFTSVSIRTYTYARTKMSISNCLVLLNEIHWRNCLTIGFSSFCVPISFFCFFAPLSQIKFKRRFSNCHTLSEQRFNIRVEAVQITIEYFVFCIHSNERWNQKI